MTCVGCAGRIGEADSGELIASLAGQESAVRAITFHPGGQILTVDHTKIRIPDPSSFGGVMTLNYNGSWVPPRPTPQWALARPRNEGLSWRPAPAATGSNAAMRAVLRRCSTRTKRTVPSHSSARPGRPGRAGGRA